MSGLGGPAPHWLPTLPQARICESLGAQFSRATQLFVKIAGETHYLWRAIDHEGEVLEAFVTKTRDKEATLKFLKKAMKRYGKPNAIVTDGLASYVAVMKELGNQDKQQTQRYLKRYLNN